MGNAGCISSTVVSCSRVPLGVPLGTLNLLGFIRRTYKKVGFGRFRERGWGALMPIVGT